ncbi:MAG: peptide chain release factor N(5)-glutamine methyltransferase [Ruminococcaceae bacterium]|nr:peptide chain release factor N(5)-glutamine methyltransferase [Oscillospiraceae bacterium]
MINAKEAFLKASTELKENGIENSTYEVREIFKELLKLNPFDIDFAQKELSQSQEDLLNDAVNRRKMHEPLQYILKKWEFMSLDFNVRSGVLIPRQDTETLVECALEVVKQNNFTQCADLCTGSGCIGISLCHYSKGLFTQGYDISDAAIELATENAFLNSCDRFIAKKHDVLLSAIGKYDIIVSNPPYIKTQVISSLQSEVKDYEPHLALDGGESGYEFYKAIIPLWKNALNKGGYMCFECGEGQAEEIVKLFEVNGFSQIRTFKDYNKIDRVISAKLL